MTAPSTKASPPAAGRRRKNDPESVRADILAVATREFSEKGLSGARIDEIAEKTRASKRMIYYYFNDKETLYLHTLEAAYQKVRLQEAELDLDHLAPLEALSRLVRFTFCHHAKNPDFIRLVMIENIHHGRFLAQSELIQSLNAGVIDALTNVYARGLEVGCFREGLDPRELHWLISALSFFNVSNQHTFSRIFDWQQAAPENQRKLEDHVTEMVLRYVGTDATLSQS
ncbi:TetR/AcrR family transcriptional regulator [Halomonas sp. AOP13-D3-9]|uniref:TetR/AcrR family transcriptional regulator n=1 Tax=Vreelandella titanicae TaxID=664683 RepID=A0A558JF80_9GAMM|nr:MULTISPECIES: TetR/AcrR family transcriptional regulator [Halomonas]AJY48671.1 transcriptional regulator, TetR family [Halomonas sp. KO116]MBR9903977.1 TetR/AcrR family transcriptional regulator [Gammaproteobacteria bacterium]TVU92301.1 TetR/AcrR family transcriptional regulator [Halomonas titanicae]CEP33765.1 Transcriptional regulator [Halomonas sp. R57-5]